jgi:flavin reductase (DIM6/NTAB) family NADH-FMN oxidoreductase RutF
MFYEPPKRNHGLPHDPMKAMVAPRPIGWISSVSPSGALNLAPYSFFNLLSEHPWIVGFSSSGRKDSMHNAEQTGEFVWSLATRPLLEKMNQTSAPLPHGMSEWDYAGLEPAACRLVRPPRVAAAPCALECVWLETIHLKDRHGTPSQYHLVLGEVIGAHLEDAYIENGLVDTAKLQPLGRCGYFDFTWAEHVVSLPRPSWP